MAKNTPETGVVRSGGGYRYYVDGHRVRGVTSIINDGIPKNLENWAAGQTAEFVTDRLKTARNPEGEIRIVADDLVRDALEWNASRDRPIAVDNSDLDKPALTKILTAVRFKMMSRAGARGTEIHKYAEQLATGASVNVPKQHAQTVDQYRRFLDEWAPTNALTEAVVINREWQYMAVVDLIADFPGVWADGPLEGQPVGRGVIDLKTGRSGIFGDVSLQVEAAAHAETILIDGEEHPMPHIDFVGAIHVTPHAYNVHSFDRGPDGDGDDTFATFLYAKEIAEWMNKDDGMVGRIRSAAHRTPIVTTEENTA